ncbi:MAG TPA: nuclear transport factor 2 family protein [Bacteroidales bacterium]|nr:nuclear transport factor 2 family protein [Bacteroidales bacterium]
MKKMFLSIVAILVIAGCKTNNQTKQVDFAAIKDTIALIVDENNKAAANKDIEACFRDYSDECLTIGTDPGEFWSFKEARAMTKQMFTDTSHHFLLIKVEKREIQVAPDGNSAVVIDQFYPFFSPKILARGTIYMVKINNKWKIHLISWAMIPKNEDLAKLNSAIK